MRYGFVVLHYKTFDVTSACIDSILALKNSNDAFIAVVDNHSENGSAEKLDEKYADNENIKVIFRPENDGFSRGNNCGYEYLKENVDPELFIISNNDVVFEDADFLNKLDKIYAEEEFCVLGVDTVNPYTAEHQNPIRQKAFTYEEISSQIASHRKKLKNLSLLCFVKNVKNALLPKKLDIALKKKMHSSERSLDTSVRHENVCLFGACQIFSRKFFEARPLPYYPLTRFYYEEDILAYNCEKYGLKTVYCPDTYILHMENVSTRSSNKGLKAHMRFKFENLIAAGEILRDYLKEEEK